MNSLQAPPIPFSSIHDLIDVELEFVTSIAAFEELDWTLASMNLPPGNTLKVKYRGSGTHL